MDAQLLVLCGGENEPDCKPEERQQQWYDWEGHDRGTFVCKRSFGSSRLEPAE